MDETEAKKVLASTDVLASRMRQGGRWHVALLFLLGIVMMALTAAYGLTLPSSARYAVAAVLVFPFMALVIYTATRPVLPRHYRSLYAVITATGGGICSVTVTVGTAVFPGEPVWWVPGAILCAVPFFIVGMLDSKASRTIAGTP